MPSSNYEPNANDLIRAAQKLWGEPTSKTKTEWRFGAHGSKSIDLSKVTWYDHEQLVGGGCLELLRQAGLEPSGNGADPSPMEIAYPYEDADGKLLKQVVRRPGHQFVQRKPNGHGTWDYTVKGVPQTPYRLPQLLESSADDAVVFIPEGEKDVDNIRALGLTATCNAGGAGKWSVELNPHFRDRHVVVLPDNDEPGRKHAAQVAEQLTPIARSVVVLALPGLAEKGDVSDWIARGGTKAQLLELVGQVDKGTATPALPWLSPFRDGEPPPAQEWVIRDRLPVQQVALYSGEGAAGKSITSLHLTVAHVLGRDWLHSMPEPGPAWFIDAEDGGDVLHRRLDAIRAHYGTTFAEIYAGGLQLMSLVGQDSLLAVANRNGLISPTPFYQALLEQAGDLKPKMIAIASLANVYGGIENDRSQVQQFIALLRKIAVVANGSLLLISHPSLAGIASDSGISGSTQWHNSVRARFYLKGVKPENGEPADSDLRLLEFRKNQYGPPAHSVTLRFKDGLFLPEGSGDSLEKLAREAKADEAFLTILHRRHEQKRPVSDNPMGPRNYAPRVFAGEPEALEYKLTMKDLELAMARLFRAGRIRNEEWGPASRRRRFIVPV